MGYTRRAGAWEIKPGCKPIRYDPVWAGSLP